MPEPTPERGMVVGGRCPRCGPWYVPAPPENSIDADPTPERGLTDAEWFNVKAKAPENLQDDNDPTEGWEWALLRRAIDAVLAAREAPLRDALAAAEAPMAARIEGKWCGYAVTDAEGEQEPCDRPAAGWRWYQDVGEHEDMLDVACVQHENEGGRLIALARHLSEALAAQTAAVEAVHRRLRILRDVGDCDDWDNHEHGDADDGTPDCCWDCPPDHYGCDACRDDDGDCVEYPCPTVAALSSGGTDALDRVRAQALRDAADAIQALHPGEVKNSVTFLRDRADRIDGGQG